jgi:hypothetical protein
MLSVTFKLFMLSVNMVNVIMLSVVVPFAELGSDFKAGGVGGYIHNTIFM